MNTNEHETQAKLNLQGKWIIMVKLDNSVGLEVVRYYGPFDEYWRARNAAINFSNINSWHICDLLGIED